MSLKLALIDTKSQSQQIYERHVMIKALTIKCDRHLQKFI